MAETIIITPVPQEQAIIPERESVVIADSETRSVSLNMADGDQVITPHPGKVLSQVTVRKPAALKPHFIKNNITIGGVVGTYQGEKLPELDDQASSGDVLAGKDYVYRLGDYLSVKMGGTLETYDGIVNLSMADGDQVVTAASGKLLSSVTITKPITLIPQVIKKGVPIGGVVGSLDPDAFELPLLNVYHTLVTTETNSANTVQKVKDYLYSLLGITETNRLFALALRATTGFVTNEVGRIVQYPNTNNWTIALYNPTATPSHWVTGSMSSTAVLQVGRQYDLYWWQVPSNVPQ